VRFPLPTSPVDGGGTETPSPRAGRAGVEAKSATVDAQLTPLLTSPVDGGGTVTPSPPAGRAGVGAKSARPRGGLGWGRKGAQNVVQ
jgi:hypothetical protein